MTRAQRAQLRRDRRDMERQASYHAHPEARRLARLALTHIERTEYDDPRPPLWLSLRLRLAGVRDAW